MQSFESEHNFESIFASCEKEMAAAFLFDKGHVERAVELMEEVLSEKLAWAEALHVEAVNSGQEPEGSFNLSCVISSRFRLAHYLFVKGEYAEAVGHFDNALSQLRQGYFDSGDLGLKDYVPQDEEEQAGLELLLCDLLAFEQAYLERNQTSRLECEVASMQALFELAETERCLRDYKDLQDRLAMNIPNRLDLQILLKVNIAACLIDLDLGTEAIDVIQNAAQRLNELQALVSSPSKLSVYEADRFGRVNLDALACQIFYLSGSANLLVENIEQAKVDFEAGIKLAEELAQSRDLSSAQIEAANQMTDLHAQHEVSQTMKEQEVYLLYLLLNLWGLSEVAAAQEDEATERLHLAEFEDLLIATSCLLRPGFRKRSVIDACLSVAFGLIEIDASSAQEVAYSAMNLGIDMCDAAYSGSVAYHAGVCTAVAEICGEAGNSDSEEYFLNQAYALLAELGCSGDSSEMRELKSKLETISIELDEEAESEPRYQIDDGFLSDEFSQT